MTRSTVARDLPAAYLPVAFGGVIATTATLTLLRPLGVDPQSAGFDPALFRLAIYSVWATLTALVLVRLLRGRGLGPEVLGWVAGQRISAGSAALAVVSALVAIVLWVPVDAIRQILGIPTYWDPGQQSFLRPSTAWDFVAAGVAGLILVPPAEETIFRGYVLQVLVTRLGFWRGLLAHNLLFALYHGGVGPGLPLYIFVWSFFPALLFLRYRSLYPAMLMHFLNNIWVDLLVPVLFG